MTWDGSIPAYGSITITIHATVKSTVPLGTAISNQATISCDANADGTNDTTVVTDDPRRPGSDDATSFVVSQGPATSFHTLPPCRLVDTRDTDGA